MFSEGIALNHFKGNTGWLLKKRVLANMDMMDMIDVLNMMDTGVYCQKSGYNFFLFYIYQCAQFFTRANI